MDWLSIPYARDQYIALCLEHFDNRVRRGRLTLNDTFHLRAYTEYLEDYENWIESRPPRRMVEIKPTAPLAKVVYPEGSRHE